MPVITRPALPTHELSGARFTSLATPTSGATSTSVWEVEISPGTPARPHRLTAEEVFVILSGTARVCIADTETTAMPGDCIVVPVDTDFSISVIGTESLRAICCLPVGGQAVLPDGQAFIPPWAR